LKTILVIGKSGQLAKELSDLGSEKINIICLGRKEIDILSIDSIIDSINKYSPMAVINASAFTQVDLAEEKVQDAYNLNAIAVGNLADACQQTGIHLTHISTDFVFDGEKSKPYVTSDKVNPIGVYGTSKAEGESLLAAKHDNFCIIRTSWVYSVYGNNFVKTILRLIRERNELNIVADQIGTPTSAKYLANACLYASVNNVKGTHHWTDLGIASWYDFAVAIQELAYENKIINRIIPIHPIDAKDYPTPAKRPHYSVLDKRSLKTTFNEVKNRHWRANLEAVIKELKKGEAKSE